MKKLALLATTVAGVAVLSSVAPAAVLFDAGGFESYTAGNLLGQNSWTADTATTTQYTVVPITVGGVPTNAVRGNGGSTNYAYPTSNPVFTPGLGETLIIEASLARNIGTTAATTSFGYAIDVYSTTARTTRFGLYSNGTTVQPFVTSRFANGAFDPTAAAGTITLGTGAVDSFINFRAVLNYSTKTLDLFLNGTSVTGGSTIPFADLTATNFSDADFQVSSVAGATDRGFLDNYRVSTASAVPEPATMAVLGLGAAAMLRRRRKSA